ncbi:MAG: TonB-dependent receptor domain-containing protein [bacterium]
MNQNLMNKNGNRFEPHLFKFNLTRRFLAAILLFVFFVYPFRMMSSLLANNLVNGRVVGKLVDAETGEPLIGANVFLEGTMIGAASDLDGNFDIKRVPPGKYTLIVSMIGYAKKKLTDLKVTVYDVNKLVIAVEPEAIVGEEVVVTARLLKNNHAALLKQRQRAAAVSDAISAEEFSRYNFGDAAEAMGHVTGITTVDGKYTYVRGLGDRYSTTRLNGAEIPSANPERRAAQLDLFPTNLLENIVTIKTATPDKPGDFTGGSVDISTKSFPETFTASFSSSYGFNTQTTLRNSFLAYQGGSKDWLGIDDGTRDVPAILKDPNVKIPDVGAAFTDAEKAQLLDQLSKSFSPVMAPNNKQAPVSQSYNFSIGSQFTLFGRPLGVIGSFNYSRDLINYTDGRSGRWQLTSNVEAVNELNDDFLLTDTKGKDDVLWGGLANFTYKIHNNHELGVNYMFSRGGESSARYQSGTFPRDLSENAIYETRALRFIERKMRSLQFRGQHYLKLLSGLRVEWIGSLINSDQDEPDLRFFTNNFTVRERNDVVDTVYSIRPSIYPVPTRYFRTLDEGNKSFNIDLILPFRLWSPQENKFKFGGAFLAKERAFRERRFEFRQDDIRYDGDPENFFSEDKVGILEEESTAQFFRFGNYVQEASQASSNYNGDQEIVAVYGMFDVPLTRRLRLVGGLRFETTRIDVASQDSTIEQGHLRNADFLPSANLIYQLNHEMNLRFAYGRTLALPTFRELAPYASFDFVGDYVFIGNPKLNRTLINNFDVRWEWFSRPGEIVAVSGFYKGFSNPIERIINPVAANPEIQYRNVSNGVVFGAEFELRKRLDQIHPVLNNFQLGANFTLVHSAVDVAEDELELIRSLDPDAASQRAFMGQSPYVLNLDFAYLNSNTGTSLSLHYNLFGKRLTEVSIGGTPDVFEQPRGILNLNFSQRLRAGFSFKFSAKNLLDSTFEKAHTFKGRKFTVQRHALGRTFSFSTTYNIQ